MEYHLNDGVPLEADDPSDGAHDRADLVHHLHVDGVLGVEDLKKSRRH